LTVASIHDRSVSTIRRTYLDWLRGIAVLLMIDAHLFDAWTRPVDRTPAFFGRAIVAGGLGTALFLFLAGVAVSLSAGSKLRRSADVGGASNAVVRRGLEIFALAFVFRLQAFIIGDSTTARDLLKVDILNIMGPSIALAALLWRVPASPRGRAIAFGAAAAATSLLTPFVRLGGFSVLPDPVRAYIVPVQGLSNFVFFPWMGLVFAGASIGAAIDGTTPSAERTIAVRIAIVGAALTAAAHVGSFMPSLYPRSDYWTTSPSYFAVRVGLMLVAIAGAYAWTRARNVDDASPLVRLGRSSFFIYWIHVEMLYGVVSRAIQHRLSFAQACLAYVGFCAFMYACAVAKDAVRGRLLVLRRGGRHG
jgi:uncharacterized membrane protein